MFKQLRFDHNNTHKRLGDGYYEQKLVNDQIANLTGKAYLPGYTSFEEQYKKLMDNAITIATEFNLTPGVKLSSEQVSKLTKDIVWLEPAKIKLEDGQYQTVLVPKIYLSTFNTNSSSLGSLISAREIDLEVKKLDNKALFLADNMLVKTENLNNQGTIEATKLKLLAKHNINNEGLIKGKSFIDIEAGNDSYRLKNRN